MQRVEEVVTRDRALTIVTIRAIYDVKRKVEAGLMPKLVCHGTTKLSHPLI